MASRASTHVGLLAVVASWFGHHADAHVCAKSRAELHEMRVEYHRGVTQGRVLWLILFMLAAIAFMIPAREADTFLFQMIGISILIGICIGGAFISAVHHLRKISYHKYRAHAPEEPAE